MTQPPNPYQPPQGQYPPPQQQYPQQPPPGYYPPQMMYVKRGNGCLWFILAIVVLSIVLVGGFFIFLGKSIDNAINAQHEVIYKLSGNVEEADVTWWNETGGQNNQTVKVPFEKKVTITGLQMASITAMTPREDEAELTCELWVDGVKKQSSTATGSMKRVDCTEILVVLQP